MADQGHLSEPENARFWAVVKAWAIGQSTDREFVREQRRIIGFLWIKSIEEKQEIAARLVA